MLPFGRNARNRQIQRIVQSMCLKLPVLTIEIIMCPQKRVSISMRFNRSTTTAIPFYDERDVDPRPKGTITDDDFTTKTE